MNMAAVHSWHPELPRIGGQLAFNVLKDIGETAGAALEGADTVFLLLFPTEAGRDGMLSPAQVHSHMLTGSQIAQRRSVPTRVRVKITEDAQGKPIANAWHVSGDHENVPVIQPVIEGDKRIYHLPDGQVVTWYPGQAPQLPKNKGYPGELLDVDNIMVHPMPTTDVEIKAQGFPLQQSDWHDAILIFPTDTGVEAVYIAYNARTRLPRNNGEWVSGEPSDGLWQSSLGEVNSITQGRPIQFANGRPIFSPWAKGVITFEPGQLNGTRSDFMAVYEYIAQKKNLPSKHAAKTLLRELELTPHHLDNVTIELVPTKLHGNIPHIGSASDMRRGN